MTNEKENCYEDSKNLNKNKTTFLTPMGSCESVVGMLPVVLSDFETNIYCEFSYKTPISSVQTQKNKIHIKNCKLLNKNSNLLIEGIITKEITATFVPCYPCKNKKLILTIPFKTIVDIEYYVSPAKDAEFKSLSCNESCDSKVFFSPASKLYSSHNYTKISECTNSVKCKNAKNQIEEYVTKITLSLGISIFQEQRIFLLEPDGESLVIAESLPLCNYLESTNISGFEVGIDKEKGLISRVIKE